jgi:protein gp37
MKNSSISWTHHTFNSWIGCTKVHEGCAHCYAEADMDKRRHRVKWGPQGTRSRTSDAYWRDPVKWNREAQSAGERHRVFCASLADVFEDWQGPIVNSHGIPLHRGDAWHMKEKYVPMEGIWIGKSLATMSDLRRDLFGIIDQTPFLDWMLLTKRPENILRMWPPLANANLTVPLRQMLQRDNVWLGTSISNQATANKQCQQAVTVAREVA